MSKKRVAIPKAKPGELRMVWGRPDRWSDPDTCYVWGAQGASKLDGSFLHHVLGSERIERDFDGPLGATKYTHSVLQELEKRGYDLTTLKFSIMQKVVNP